MSTPTVTMGRPAGEVRTALLKACTELATADKGATLRELAAAAQVGTEAARWAVKNLRRAGHLVQVRERRVAYRNRPVAEYALPASAHPSHSTNTGFALLAQAWG